MFDYRVPRHKWIERFYLGVGSLGALLAVHEFARSGVTRLAVALAVGAALSLGFGSLLRRFRKLAEFKERYPAWREREPRKRRWWRR